MVRTSLPLIVSLLFCAPAFAEEKSSAIDMTTVMTEMNGKKIPDAAQPDCKDCWLTLGEAIAVALCNDSKDTANDSALVKYRNCAFGEQIRASKTVTLTAKQITLIEDRIKVWSPSVIARIVPLIDPVQAEKSQKDW